MLIMQTDRHSFHEQIIKRSQNIQQLQNKYTRYQKISQTDSTTNPSTLSLRTTLNTTSLSTLSLSTASLSTLKVVPLTNLFMTPYCPTSRE